MRGSYPVRLVSLTLVCTSTKQMSLTFFVVLHFEYADHVTIGSEQQHLSSITDAIRKRNYPTCLLNRMSLITLGVVQIF